MDLAVPAEHLGKIKESQKKDEYLELKNQWNVKLTVIAIVVGAIGTVLKGLVKALERLEIRVRGAYDKFPDLFRMGIFTDRAHMKLLFPSK